MQHTHLPWLVAPLAIALCGITRADLGDVYVSQNLSPSLPVIEVDDTVTWGPDWTGITLPYTTTLDPGEVIYLGLENRSVEEMLKRVTLEYEAVEAILPGGTLAGYPAAFPGTTIWDSVTHGYSGPTHRHLVEGEIFPQPGWEWIELTNTGSTSVPVEILTYTSECVPEPASLAVTVGGTMLLRRRRGA